MESNEESHEEVISVWMQAWELLKEKVLDNKEKNQGLVPEIYEIDEATDYEYDIEGWLDDLTDELLHSGKYEEKWLNFSHFNLGEKFLGNLNHVQGVFHSGSFIGGMHGELGQSYIDGVQ